MSKEIPSIISDIRQMRQSSQKARSVVEHKWEVSYRLLEGYAVQSNIIGSEPDSVNSGRYVPYSNRIANAVNNKYAALTEVFERPVVLPRSADEPSDLFMSKKGKIKMDLIGVAVDEPMTELDEQNILAVPHPQDPQAQTPFFDEEDFVRVTNDIAADGITEEMQSEWLKSHCDLVMNKAKHQKIVIGHSDLMVQWDAKKKNFYITHLSPYNVWLDPLAINTFNAEYVIVRQIMPLSAAIEKWPDHEQAFRDGVASGSSDWVVNNYEGTVGPGNVTNNDSKTIEHLTAFIRNSGGHEIRQVEFIGDIVLEDAASPFVDIPVVRDIHIPRASTNLGVGDPEYLWELQDLYRRLLGIIYEHSLYSRASMHVMPKTVFDQLKTYLARAYTLAGQFLPVSDDQYMMHQGQPIRELKPPELARHVFETLQLVSQEIDRLSGQTDVSRGEAKAGWSGSLYEQASMNGRTPIGMTARHTVLAIKHLMRVAINLMMENLSAKELSERNRAYPVQVWEAIMKRMENIEYDFEVQVAAASKKEGDFQKLLAAAQNMPELWQSREFVKAVAKKGDLPDADRLSAEIMAARQQALQAQQK